MPKYSPHFAFAFLLTATPVVGQSIVAGDGGPVISWYVNEGGEVSKSIDDYGDPLLSVSHYGRDFEIYFYGCKDGDNCTAIQFYSGYRTEGGVRQGTINEWNAGRRYLRSYLSDSGSSRIEYDVYLGENGMSQDDFAEVTAIWLRGMRDFEEHIDWK